MSGPVAILGAGGMGTALALLFARSAVEVRLWSRDPGHAREFARTRVNERHLPGIRVPDLVRITSGGRRGRRRGGTDRGRDPDARSSAPRWKGSRRRSRRRSRR